MEPRGPRDAAFHTTRWSVVLAAAGRSTADSPAVMSGESRRMSYRDAAEKLQISEGAASVAAHRLRKRFRQLLREAVSATVERDEEIDDECGSS
jgi:DNA-directed RNA polymerase specialized sigma24 family protein